MGSVGEWKKSHNIRKPRAKKPAGGKIIPGQKKISEMIGFWSKNDKKMDESNDKTAPRSKADLTARTTQDKNTTQQMTVDS